MHRASRHERHQRRRQRQISGRMHWSIYAGAALLLLGVATLVTAALLTH